MVTASEGAPERRWSAFSSLATAPSALVLQPTTLCNLDCSYCYLPLRRSDLRMPVEVARAVAADVNEWARVEPLDVIWHGGEPLAAGREHLAELMEPFDRVRHHVQTNATLLDDAWCDLLAEREVRVGVSLDGPATRNLARTNRVGQPAYDRILRGMGHLRRRGIEYSVIAVVSDPCADAARELYGFFADLGCAVLGINIEETEGVNTRSNAHDPAAVAEFWTALTAAWERKPVLRVRELERVLGYVAAEFDGRADEFLPAAIDPFPTVAHNGDVVLLSPELAGFAGFAVGNVLTEPLSALVGRGSEQDWVAEFRRGVEACQRECPLFGFCGGGQPANRYFEHGRLDGTRTCHCQNSRISLLEGVVAHARTH